MSEYFFGSNKGFEILANLGLNPLSLLLLNAIKHCCRNQMPLFTAAIIHYHHQTLLSIVPLSMHCHHWRSLPPSNANAYCEHLPPSNTDTCNYNAKGCNAIDDCCTQSPCPWMQKTTFRDEFLCPLLSLVVIAAHPGHPPTAFYCRLQSLLIVKYIYTNFSTFILAFVPSMLYS
jgi:hypothetical protein